MEATTIFGQTHFSKGNRTVIVSETSTGFEASLWVNTRNGIQNGDITLQRWAGKTFQGAKNWASKVLK